MAKNTGKDYEFFVAELQQAILISEEFVAQKNITVEINKFLKDKHGIERQFDIYWEFELGGVLCKNIIECKDYASKISIEKVDSLIGKLRDFNNIRGIFATKTGYQSGAEAKAIANGIDVLIVREQNGTDWISKEGEPLIKEAILNFTIESPALITDLRYLAETEENAGNIGRHLNNEVFIKNLDTGEQFSIYDFGRKLADKHINEYGIFEEKKLFRGELIYPNGSKKIIGYHVFYQINEPAIETINLEFYKKLKGVIEYLHNGKKTKVFEGGRILKE